MAERPAMMNKLSLEETLREQIDGLETKLESEVIENLRHLGDLRYYEEMQIPELQKQLSEARAEIDRIKSDFITTICNLDVDIADKNAEIDQKDALIEQMREALTGVCEICPCDTAKEDKKCQDCDVGAALSAAERGE